MSISLDSAQNSSEDSQPAATRGRGARRAWLTGLFWAAIVLLLAGAVLMRLYQLDQPFDRGGYDEGVYWQSLRSMLAGYPLYHQTFYSQPPMFLLSTFPGFALFGDSLWAARLDVALISLLGFLGAYLLGKTLAGRAGALAAMLLLLVDPFYLAQSQTVQAEASSVAFTFLAIAFAFLWWKKPDGWRGCFWAALCGLTFALSVLCKLLCISTIIPIAYLMGARIWQIWRKQPGTSGRSWLPLLAGAGAMLLTVAVTILPFTGSAWGDFWSGMITFHTVASKLAVETFQAKLSLMWPALLSLQAAAAIYGIVVAWLRKDRRVLPLLAWLLVTFVALMLYRPLFIHHIIAIEPPLISLAVLGVAKPAAYKQLFANRKSQRGATLLSVLALLLVLSAVVFNGWQDVLYYQTSAGISNSADTQKDLRAARDLNAAITANQWVITDGQFIASLADRSTPPSLVDTSSVRITTNYVTLAQLEQAASDPRVHAVLFYTNRFYAELPAFHTWVTLHFHLLRVYDNHQELWVR